MCYIVEVKDVAVKVHLDFIVYHSCIRCRGMSLSPFNHLVTDLRD